jgi:hypothetical protein
MTRRYLVLLGLGMSVLTGCGPKVDIPETTHGGWTALQEFSMDTLMIVGPDASQKRWAAVRKGASSDAFQQGVEKLGAAELPPSLSAQKGLKDEAVTNLRSLIAAAKTGGDNKALEDAWDQAKSSLDKLTTAVEAKH